MQEQTLEVVSKQAAKSYADSVLFTKKVTWLAISMMTYIKAAFPEENFETENFSGVQIKILKEDCMDELAQFLSTSLMKAFDAIDRKYLHKLAVCFYEDDACDAENLLKYILFEYTYSPSGAGVRMDVSCKSRHSSHQSRFTFEHVHAQINKLIRDCMFTMAEPIPLPKNYDISLRVYYNDATPDDYQAPGYLRVSDEEDHLNISEIRRDLQQRLGSVETPFHCLLVQSYTKQVILSSNYAEPSQNVPMMTQMDDFDDREMCPPAKERPTAESARRGRMEDNDGGLMPASACDIMQRKDKVREQLRKKRKLVYQEESELVERLEAESLHEAPPRDPVGDALGLRGRTTLQGAAVLGKMINPPKQKIVEDKTLQQYKEAIKSSQDVEEDFPLSGNHNPVEYMNWIGKGTRKRQAGKENTASGKISKKVE